MASPSADEALKKALDEKRSNHTEQWALKTDLGAINFIEILPELKAVRRLAEELLQSDLTIYPSGKFAEFERSVRDLNQRLGAMQGFNINQQNPTGERNAVQSQILEAYQ